MESELITLISQVILTRRRTDLNPRASLISLISIMTQMISTVSSLDLESQQPKSDVISLISQIISVARSTSVSDPDRELVSLATMMISLIRSAHPVPEPELMSLVDRIFTYVKKMDWRSELGSLLDRILSVTDYTDWDLEPDAEGGVPEHLICLFPQLEVRLVGDKFCVAKELPWKSEEDGSCKLNDQKVLLRGGEEVTHFFFCRNCRGRKHEDRKKAPVEVKHPLHPRHSLQLVLWRFSQGSYRQCYCCDEGLERIFYYCCHCDCAISVACVEEKAPVLSVHHPKWHDHPLAMFPRQAFLICNLCALPHSDCPYYICPPCDFVAHQSCLNLPRVIKISRHLHRLSFTLSFDQGDWFCGVCRKKIHKDYGGYSCTRDGCSYAAHSKCATQSNIWDGQELEGTPDEHVDDEKGFVAPFLRIGNGIIQHFSHQHHRLRLDENADRDYDEYRICEACVTPIYFGNFYSCMQCDFILHEECAKLSRKIHHPIHPHLLTLVTQTGDRRINIMNRCSACPWCVSGFFYECGNKEGCNFKLHVPCATISEPLIHRSHIHPLFLTSKPGEQRKCALCTEYYSNVFSETVNCIECDFSLCFKCATMPQEVRYKHDKHMFILTCWKETNIMTDWCEACEGEITPNDMFYSCDESCSVTLHTHCLAGLDLYMKPGLLLKHPSGVNIEVLRNCMSRPICKLCEKHCPFQIVFQCYGNIFCCIYCALFK